MASLFRRRAHDADGIAPRRPQPGVLRRERRALLKAREDALRDLGGPLGDTCPRCGATRDPDQRYCLDCGLELPAVNGRLPGLRRRWIRRFGWYPGDWVWMSLLTLLVAIAGASTAIVLTETTTKNAGGTFST